MQNDYTQLRNDHIPTVPTFNPLTHIPPSFDLYGHEIPINRNQVKYNILSEKENIKTPWDTNPLTQSTPMTRTKLLQIRKKENIPDISYDLDGDGYVGGRDYVLAKRFDVDGDGKLNEQEKKKALEAINNGVEREYVWNLENQGGKRAFRILQKRGKIIDAENFVPLQESYPKHPISFREPKNGVHTLNELKEYRKNKTKEEISEKVKKFHKEHLPNKSLDENNFNNYYYFTENKEKPKYSSINDIKNKLHKEARIKVGLNENESDLKNYDLAPTLKYVDSPKHKVKEDIKKDLQKESYEISKILNSRKHLNEVERLKQREDEIFNKLFRSDEGFTLNKLKEQRRQKLNEYNLKTFSERPKGVHGQELPKFSKNENTKEFWKFREGYVENPKHSSQSEYLQEIKYWKKPEELLLNEHRDYIEPIREKRTITVPNKIQEITPNVNKINFYKGFDPYYVKPVEYKIKSVHKYRWTSLMDKFLSGKFKSGRLFEALENEDKKKEMENIRKIKQEDIKEKIETDKNKEIVDIPPEKPLFQKFGSKEGITLTSSTEVRYKGF